MEQKDYENYIDFVYDYIEKAFFSEGEREVDLNVFKEMIRCLKSWDRMRVVMFLAKKIAEEKNEIKVIPEVL
ncbi:MAG: hypothetical protein DWQ06_04940 [Calditrichaeota bacterium]|nr:MAG: hypothetical protein DWQ06_04940 [Calditrichota bacterium]